MNPSRIVLSTAAFALLLAGCGGQDPVAAPTQLPTSGPTSAQVVPTIEIGAPLDAYFGSASSGDGPNRHHFIGTAGANWAVDLGAAADSTVRLHLTATNARVIARVDRIAPTCGNDATRGGLYVKVGAYVEDTLIGSVTFGHVVPSVEVGDEVSTDGGKVGTVNGALPNDASCWTGPHVHLEASNADGFACFDKRFRRDGEIGAGTRVGLIGDTGTTRERHRCS